MTKDGIKIIGLRGSKMALIRKDSTVKDGIKMMAWFVHDGIKGPQVVVGQGIDREINPKKQN